MKLLIASDIHGAADACASLVKAIEIHEPDRVVLLGDLLYHGPRNDLPADYAPKRVIAMLNAHANRIVAIRGNCEAEVDQMVLDFPCMATYNQIFDPATGRARPAQQRTQPAQPRARRRHRVRTHPHQGERGERADTRRVVLQPRQRGHPQGWHRQLWHLPGRPVHPLPAVGKRNAAARRGENRRPTGFDPFSHRGVHMRRDERDSGGIPQRGVSPEHGLAFACGLLLNERLRVLLRDRPCRSRRARARPSSRARPGSPRRGGTCPGCPPARRSWPRPSSRSLQQRSLMADPYL